MANKKINNNRIVELAKYESPIVKESNKDEWIEFGADNNYFQYLIDRYTYSPTNNAIINNIIKLVFGKGIKALDASKKVMDWANMLSVFDTECTKKLITDLKMLGQYAFQVHYSKDHKSIIKALHIPVHLLRPEKCDEEGKINGYFYSDNWLDTKQFVPKRFSAFGTSKDEIEILYMQPYSVGLKYFSLVDYQGALPYSVLEQEISDYLINEVQNGFSGTKIVNFNNSVPSEEEMDDIERRVVGKLTGSKGKRVIVSFNTDEKYKTTVDDIALNDAPAHYEYLSDECLRKIMLGHNVTSPLLFGISTANGFSSNADELKNSFILYYNMVIVPLQEEILRGYDKILAFNGVSLNLYFETLKPLEFSEVGNVQPIETNTELSAINTELEAILKEVDNNQLGGEWVEVDSREVGDNELELDSMLLNAQSFFEPKKSLLSKVINLVQTGNPQPNIKSEQDKKVGEYKYFKVRYRYTGNKSPERQFCKAMMSQQSRLFRKEDIDAMSLKAVNPGFGELGANTYDIFKFKGGARCHHKFERVTYMLDLDKIEDGYKEIGTAAASVKGYKVTNPYEVSFYPNNLPLKGFSPKNKNLPKDVL
jgi:hypothetical protein